MGLEWYEKVWICIKLNIINTKGHIFEQEFLDLFITAPYTHKYMQFIIYM
jgi:hypothetical protein